MALSPARLFDIERDLPLLPQLVQLHHDCISNDFTLATFLPPLKMDEMTRYWELWLEDVKQGSRAIIIQCAPRADHEEVVGVVSLWMPPSETGSFRSEVHKLLVSPKHRYKGIGRTLMSKLEEVARQKQKWLLVGRKQRLWHKLTWQLLDTTIGSGAEYVYPKLGYKQIGIVPNYGFSPEDGKLRDEMFFYKDLREETVP